MARTRQGPRPVVKWAGGKTALLDSLVAAMPTGPFHTYAEPFAGGAALFFHLAGEARRRFRRAILADKNGDLVSLYRVVKRNPTALIAAVKRIADEHLSKDGAAREAHFYAMRDVDPATLSPVDTAARLVFLNKTCFNGLFRVNAKGKFNVPFGRYAKPKILDEAALMAAHEALRDVTIVLGDFRKVSAKLERGDFAYFDPPYVPLSKTASFTAYAKDPFGAKEQRALADELARLRARGVLAMLSNASSSETEALYEDFYRRKVPVPRSINSNPKKRGDVEELIVTTYRTGKRPAP